MEKEELVEEQIVEEVKKEEKIEDKSFENSKKKTGIGRKIFNIVFWVGVALLAAIWITDFLRVRNNKEPQFCLKETVHEFEDGTVTECMGLGYKTYKYNRSSLSGGIEFGPFFIKMKEK